MTREEKDLLLKDLCARLPYGVKCSFGVDDAIYEVCGINPTCCGASEIQATHIKSNINGDFSLSSCKPFLFPLTSMTDEQYDKFNDMGYSVTENYYDSIANYHQIDWFNKNHLDYRGLIKKGLAIDCTNLDIY